MQPAQAGGDRRQPAPAVDQDRHAPLGRDREHGREPLVVEQEALRSRMELDPARAELEAPARLLDRALGQVEPDEREQPAVRPSRPRRACGRSAPGTRVPVGLVHAEHVRPGDAVGVHDPEQLVEAALHAVDVVAEMRVDVEDVGAVRQLGAELVVPERAHLERTIDCSVHRSTLAAARSGTPPCGIGSPTNPFFARSSSRGRARRRGLGPANARTPRHRIARGGKALPNRHTRGTHAARFPSYAQNRGDGAEGPRGREKRSNRGRG